MMNDDDDVIKAFTIIKFLKTKSQRHEVTPRSRLLTCWLRKRWA